MTKITSAQLVEQTYMLMQRILPTLNDAALAERIKNDKTRYGGGRSFKHKHNYAAAVDLTIRLGNAVRNHKG